MDTLTYRIHSEDKQRLENLYQALDFMLKMTSAAEKPLYVKPEQISAVLSLAVQELGIATFNIKKLEIN